MPITTGVVFGEDPTQRGFLCERGKYGLKAMGDVKGKGVDSITSSLYN